MIILLITPFLMSSAADVCEDLYATSCQQVHQEVDDGTGIETYRQPTANEVTQIHQLQDRYKQQFVNTFFLKYGQNKTKQDEVLFRQAIEWYYCERSEAGCPLRIKTTQKINQVLAELHFFQEMIESIKISDEAIKKDAFPDYQQGNLEKTFGEQIKKVAISFLEKKIPNSKKREQLIEKIREIRFVEKICNHNFFNTNANYTFVNKTITYCLGGVFQKSSLFRKLMILSHEVAHSIEPCGVGIDVFPWPMLTSCLRSEQSVAAKDFRYQQGNQFMVYCKAQKNACEHGVSLSCDAWDRYGCKQNQPRCLRDQIDEAFADWFGIEILVMLLPTLSQTSGLTVQNYRDGLFNIVKASCGDQYAVEGLYPQPTERFNGLLLQHPWVRKILSCTKNHSKWKYCSVESEK